LFRSTHLPKDLERLAKGLNLGPDFDKTVEDLSTKFAGSFAGSSNVDVVRSSVQFELFIDPPGVDPATVDLTLDARTFGVSATRNFSVTEDHEHVFVSRRHGAFHRSFTLADDLDTEGLTARSKHGVLIVDIPATATPRPRKIDITHARPG
jgi:HSP20 family protein